MIMEIDQENRPRMEPGLVIVVQISPALLQSVPRENLPQGIINCLADDMFDVREFDVQVLDGNLDEDALRGRMRNLVAEAPALTLVLDTSEKVRRATELCVEERVRFRTNIFIGA